MKTQTVGTNAKRIRVELPEETAAELERRAASMHLTTSRYALHILLDCINSDKTLMMQENQLPTS